MKNTVARARAFNCMNVVYFREPRPIPNKNDRGDVTKRLPNPPLFAVEEFFVVVGCCSSCNSRDAGGGGGGGMCKCKMGSENVLNDVGCGFKNVRFGCVCGL